jgi:hypothetical protein
MLKELAYRLASTRGGALMVDRLGDHLDVPELPAPSRPTHPIQIALTIDTEGGYVGASEERVWQGRAPDAFQGYIDGIPNLLAVLSRHAVKATFLVSPHGLSARGESHRAVEQALGRIASEGHEIGLHLHPTSDRALQRELGRTFASPRASDLSDTDRRLLLETGSRLLATTTGARLRSFRWGNWALDPRSASAIADAGFTIDSSAVPRLRDRNGRFDWSRSNTRTPWTIAPGLLEVPIATYRLGPAWLRADPLYGPLLRRAFDLYRARAPRDARPFPFVAMTHSTEATYRDGSPTRTLSDLDRFLSYALAFPDVRAVRLQDLVAD